MPFSRRQVKRVPPASRKPPPGFSSTSFSLISLDTANDHTNDHTHDPNHYIVVFIWLALQLFQRFQAREFSSFLDDTLRGKGAENERHEGRPYFFGFNYVGRESLRDMRTSAQELQSMYACIFTHSRNC